MVTRTKLDSFSMCRRVPLHDRLLEIDFSLHKFPDLFFPTRSQGSSYGVDRIQIRALSRIKVPALISHPSPQPD